MELGTRIHPEGKNSRSSRLTSKTQRDRHPKTQGHLPLPLAPGQSHDSDPLTQQRAEPGRARGKFSPLGEPASPALPASARESLPRMGVSTPQSWIGCVPGAAQVLSWGALGSSLPPTPLPRRQPFPILPIPPQDPPCHTLLGALNPGAQPPYPGLCPWPAWPCRPPSWPGGRPTRRPRPRPPSSCAVCPAAS